VVKESLKRTDIVTYPILLFVYECIGSVRVAVLYATITVSTGRQSTAARAANRQQARSTASNRSKSTFYSYINYVEWFYVAGITANSVHQPPDNRQ
jgi:hypothetical protein